MKILNAVEQETFDTPPVFNSVQRKRYFDFSMESRRQAVKLRTPTNRLCFLLNWGYFKASKRFFAIGLSHRPDIEYVARHAGIDLEMVNLDSYDKQSLLRHHQTILQLNGFSPFDENAQVVILHEIETMIRSQLKPRLIFWRCVDLLISRKIQIPTYFRLSELILKAINNRKQELAVIIENNLSDHLRASLDEFFVQTSALDDEPISSKTAAYKLTLLKKLSQSTKPSRIKESAGDLALLKDLFESLQPILKLCKLNHGGIRYYATSVIKSEIFQMARRQAEDRYLHIIAFITYQYYRLQDNLIDVLLTSLQSYQNSALREHKEQCYVRRVKRTEAVKSLIDFDEKFLDTLSEIRTISRDERLDDTCKVEHIRTLLEASEAEHNNAESEISALKTELENDLSGNDYYLVLESRSVRIQNRVSPIIKNIDFQGESHAQDLLEAIRYFKERDGGIDKAAPVDFLKPAEHEAITEDGQVSRVSLYKAFLFIHIQSAIKSGALNLKHSYKYRPLNDYLIDRDRWRQNKDALVERAGLKNFVNPQKILKELDEALYRQYERTNHRIQDGSNTLVSFSKKGAFRLKTPRKEDVEAEPIQNFFPERQYISLLEVMATVNRYSGFLKEFQHWQQRYHREKPPPSVFYAGIIGLGCGIGTRKMARISQQINEPELENTVNWFFSPEGTRAGNDRVTQLMNQLDLPNIYRRSQDQLHTSSDGQKFEVKSDSLNANYSFKYFGKGQGVSVYSFIDERSLLWHSVVISAAERESAYVIDGLMHNDVVKSDIHSTDSHGYSEAIFGATHLLGFSYAPRIKNLKRQRIYIIKGRGKDKDPEWKIKPSGYIDIQLIEENWDDILRLITTIKLKETTSSEIFRRLNSYSKQHGLYRSLKAFGKIIKSIFILRYIDDVELRQAIESQLNKIEQAHQFSRAVSVGNPREFIPSEKQEQEIAEGCKRLIKNSITCWNYLYLSQKIKETIDPENRDKLIRAISNGSVVTWQHINLLGEYDFSEERLRDSVGIKPPNIGRSSEAQIWERQN
jgi:TnpA family transposase